MKNIDKHINLITTIIESHDSVVKAILKSVDKKFITFLGELALNILKKVITISSYYITKLKKYTSIVRLIGSTKINPEKRRKLCVQHSKAVVILLKASKQYF